MPRSKYLFIKLFFLFCLLALISKYSKGQNTPPQKINSNYQFKSVGADSGGIRLPKYQTLPMVPTTNYVDSGAIAYQKSDSGLYQWTGHQWIRIGGVGFDPLPSQTFLGNARTTTQNHQNLHYSVKNVLDFGAHNDSSGSLNIALDSIQNAFGSCAVYIPAGKYLMPHRFKCLNTMIFFGDGEAITSQAFGNLGGGTIIYGGANDSSLFYCDSNALYKPVFGWEDMTIVNNKPTIPTSGFAIEVTGFTQRPWTNHVTIVGFYECIHISSAFYYSFFNTGISSPISVGLSLEDSGRLDTGDGVLDNVTFIAGRRSGVHATAFKWISGGGIKMSNIKVDAQDFDSSHFFNYGLYMFNRDGSTSDIQGVNLSLENALISHLFDSAKNGTNLIHHQFSNVQIASTVPYGPAIYFHGIDGVTLNGFNVQNFAFFSTPFNPPAILVDSSHAVDISHGSVFGFPGGEVVLTGTTYAQCLMYNYTFGLSGTGTSINRFENKYVGAQNVELTLRNSDNNSGSAANMEYLNDFSPTSGTGFTTGIYSTTKASPWASAGYFENKRSGGFRFLTSGVDVLSLFNNGNVSVGLDASGPTIPSAVLSAGSTTGGFLPPRMTTIQKLAISSPARGLMVYDNALNQMSYFNGTIWVNF